MELRRRRRGSFAKIIGEGETASNSGAAIATRAKTTHLRDVAATKQLINIRSHGRKSVVFQLIVNFE